MSIAHENDISPKMEKWLTFMDTLYESISIYNCLIIHNNDIPHNFIHKLIEKSYPVYNIKKIEKYTPHIDDKNARIFLMHNNVFDQYIYLKTCDLYQITIVITTTESTYKRLCRFISGILIDKNDIKIIKI